MTNLATPKFKILQPKNKTQDKSITHKMIGLRPNTTQPHYQAPTNIMSQFDVLKTIHDASSTSADDETVPTGVVQSSTRL